MTVTDFVARERGIAYKVADLSLAEVIQLLNLNRRSGILYVDSSTKGKIVFHSGKMIYGKYGEWTGEEAIYKVVPEPEGTFHFEPGEKEINQNIGGATMTVLIEACRLADESNIH